MAVSAAVPYQVRLQPISRILYSPSERWSATKGVYLYTVYRWYRPCMHCRFPSVSLRKFQHGCCLLFGGQHAHTHHVRSSSGLFTQQLTAFLNGSAPIARTHASERLNIPSVGLLILRCWLQCIVRVIHTYFRTDASPMHQFTTRSIDPPPSLPKRTAAGAFVTSYRTK